MSTRGILVLGDQLFDPELLQRLGAGRFFMAEDYELCERFQCHKHKLIFFLSAMRHHAKALQQSGRDVDYVELNEATKSHRFEEKLRHWKTKYRITELAHFEISDSFFRSRIEDFCSQEGIAQKVFTSPMFLDESGRLVRWMKSTKRPFMKAYYEERRKKTGYLMESDGSNGKPLGGGNLALMKKTGGLCLKASSLLK